MSGFALYNVQIAKRYGGDVVAAILLERVRYWHEKMNGQFFKFSEPCTHPLYRQGDSWTEELGITLSQFRRARRLIAGKQRKTGDNSPSQTPVVFWRDRQNRLWYRFNAAIYAQMAMPDGENVNREMPNPHSAKCENDIPRDAILNEPLTKNTSIKTSKKNIFKKISSSSTDTTMDSVPDAPKYDDDDEQSKSIESIKLLKNAGVADAIANRLGQQHDAVTIREVLRIASDKRNPAGYAIITLENGFGSTSQIHEHTLSEDFISEGIHDFDFDSSPLAEYLKRQRGDHAYS